MVRLGIIGLGAAAQAFITPVKRHDHVTVTSVCDPRPEARESFSNALDAPSLTNFEALIGSDLCDAVYIGTPTDLHFEHASAALNAGLHVLLEKPMCIHAQDGFALADEAEARGLALVVGHSHSHDLPIRAMREIIQSGRLGRVRMVNILGYTDWVYRPRRAEELRPDMGGGVTYRQGAHQFDILSSLCGDQVVSVTGHTFDFDPERSTVGAHSATLTFANGAIGTAVYNGYGHFASSELTGEVGEWGYVTPYRPRTDTLAASLEDELARKRARAKTAIGSDAPHQPHFGMVLVSCEKGDIRQSPDGLLIYTAEGCEEHPLDNNRTPRDLVLDEFVAAVGGTPPLHDGRWGATVVSICDAVHESARTGKPVPLTQT